MNMNNRLRTTLYEMDIRIHTVDVSHEVTYHENYLKQILPTIFFYQKYIRLDENSFILCSLKQILPTIFFYQKYIRLDENSFILCSLMTVFNIRVNIFGLTKPN